MGAGVLKNIDIDAYFDLDMCKQTHILYLSTLLLEDPLCHTESKN